jgi:Na+-transporting NADH:ubiquinone oxidoreductase subunit NqrC
MTNIQTLKIETTYGEVVEHILIDHGNGEFTSMPKSNYDAMQAEQSTPSLTDEASTK